MSRKVVPETLLAAQNKYHNLVENLAVGVYRNTSGAKGQFLEANSAIVKMFEAKSKKEFMEHNVSDFYQDPEKRQAFVEEIVQKGEVKNRIVDLVTLKGRKFIGSVTAVMKRDENGQIYFDGVIDDVTEHQKFETEMEDQVTKRTIELEHSKQAMLNVMEDLELAKTLLEQEKAKDEATLASISDGLVAVDQNRKVTIINRAAEDLLGWKASEVIGSEITALPLEDEEGNVIPLEKRPTTLAFEGNVTAYLESFFVKKDKTKIPVAITATPVKLGGKTIGLVEIIRNVTQEKEIDKAKSEFVSLASHQLRTPLGIIKWYLEAMGSEDYFIKAPETIKKYYDEIYTSNERVLSLVRDLLSVSRIDQRKIKDTPKLIDVIQAVKEVTEQMKIVARKKEVILNLTLPDKKIPLLMLDQLRFHEVLQNLINNAIEYSNVSGKVEISVKKDTDNLIISVQDTGIGISVPDQKKLFTKFFRSEKATGHNPEGSGLGLYVVKAYVEGWGGHIKVESVEGSGSAFTVSLPIKGGESK